MRDKDILHFAARIIIMYHVGIAHSMLEGMGCNGSDENVNGGKWMG